MDGIINSFISNIWIFLVIVYGVFKGLREGVKKKAMEQSSMESVLFFYTLIGFLMSVPFAGNPFDMPALYYFCVLIKSFVIFLAWIMSFSAIKKMPIGYYGILDMARVLFSTMLGVTVLGEVLNITQIFGLTLVLSGILLINFRKVGKDENVKARYIIISLSSCLLNSISSLLDKVLMSSGMITEGQLQFWFMLFMAGMYFIYMKSKGTPLKFSEVKNNYWIIILSALLIIGDRSLFIANRMPQSSLTAMTVIKQCAVLVTIIEGRLMYKESRFYYKLLCAGIMIAGILLYIIF